MRLHSFEFVLRHFLATLPPSATTAKNANDWNPQTIKPGQIVPVNSFTEFPGLGSAVAQYNGQLKASEIDLTVDAAIVSLGDSLAHGRMISLSPPDSDDCTMTLFRFGKHSVKDTTTTVTEVTLMTREWLTEQAQFVLTQMNQIQACAARRRHGIFRFDVPKRRKSSKSRKTR